jgi:hypothetical protein
MQRRNVVGVTTRYGYRTCELHHGDITALDRNVDVLVISAVAGSYSRIPGTVIQALYERLGIDAGLFARDPEFDLRTALGVWISGPILNQRFTRIACAELRGSGLPVATILDNVFVALSVLEAKQIPVRTVALPVLGAGSQGLSAEPVANELIHAAKRYLMRANSAESVLFVEIDSRRADQIGEAMDAALGRVNAIVPSAQLLHSVRGDLTHSVCEADDLFQPDKIALRDDWLRLLTGTDVRVSELGMLGRRLVELVVSRVDGRSAGKLHERIYALEKHHNVAPWVCGYMHVLRHLGNEAAHEGHSVGREPPFIEEADLALSLLCIERLLDFWRGHSNHSGAV